MKNLCYIFILLFAFNLQAQPPSKWYNKYGFLGIDVGYGIRETYDRQYIVCGSTSSFGNGGIDANLLLIDSMGQKIWEKSYGGAMTDVAKNLIINPTDSGFIFTGYTNSIGFGGYDIYIVRTNKNGIVIWQKSFGGFDWDFGNDLVFSPDGNIIVCGNSYSSKYGKSDGCILKINTGTGVLMWQKYYGGVEDDDLRAVALTPDGHYVLTGKTNSYGDIKGDIYFIKLDLNGDSVLYNSYGQINKIDYGNDILNDFTNHYVIVGGSETYSYGMKDAFIMKLDSIGNFVWEKHYGYSNLDEEATSVNQTYNHQGRYTISYSDIDIQFFKRDPKNLALDFFGDVIFGTSFGETEDEEMFATVNTSDKGYVAVGYTKSYGSVLEDVYVVKYDSMFNFGGKIIGLNESYKKPTTLKVYPNVINNSNSIVTIESDSEIRYSIFDLSSRVISKMDINESNFEKRKEINLQSLSNGLYILSVWRQDRRYQFKIIKQ